MPSSARITILGHITMPEAKVTPDGTDIVNFSVATTERRRNEELTSWWRVTVFGGRAKGLITLMDRGSFGKGVLVQVTGSVTQRQYTAGSGEARTSVDVNADSVEVIFTKQDQPSNDSVPF